MSAAVILLIAWICCLVADMYWIALMQERSFYWSEAGAWAWPKFNILGAAVSVAMMATTAYSWWGWGAVLPCLAGFITTVLAIFLAACGADGRKLRL